MKTIYLNAIPLIQPETAHPYLKEVFGLADYYGKNLDALNDGLYDLQDDITIMIDEDTLSTVAANPYAFTILQIMNDVCNNKLNMSIVYMDSQDNEE